MIWGERRDLLKRDRAGNLEHFLIILTCSEHFYFRKNTSLKTSSFLSYLKWDSFPLSWRVGQEPEPKQNFWDLLSEDTCNFDLFFINIIWSELILSQLFIILSGYENGEKRCFKSKRNWLLKWVWIAFASDSSFDSSPKVKLGSDFGVSFAAGYFCV